MGETLSDKGRTDEELVRLTLENQDNFLFIIQKYKIKLYNFIRRITNVCDEDAEDILQEVFFKAYSNLNDFDPDLKFSSWIYSIARNQAISNHRKLKARAEGYAIPLDDDLTRNLICNLDIKKEVDSIFLKKDIQRVLDCLDEKYKEVLVLKFLEEKSYEEISDIIKKPVGTVGSMINKAKKDFKREMLRQKISS